VKLVRTITELRDALEPRRNETIALVPTMGALHEGHLSLLRAARAESDLVVASLFVNPAQFGEGSDLNGYPRDEAHDVSLAEAAGVDVLFVPDTEEMYPPGFQTWVDVEQLGARLEGVHRPGHFRGVTTICLKLFNIVRPQRAYFGRSLRETRVSRRRSASVLAPSTARSRRRTRSAHASSCATWTSTTSRLRTSSRASSLRPSALARHV